MPQKSILIVLENYPFAGGVERTTTLLANSLYVQGAQIVVLSARGEKGLGACFSMLSEIPLLHLPNTQQIECTENQAFVAKVLEEHQIDIIWNQGISVAITQLTLPFADRVRYVATLHNAPDAFLQSLRASKAALRLGLKQSVKRLLWPLYVGYHWRKTKQFYATLYRQCDAFVLLSDSFKAKMMQVVSSSDGAKFITITNPLANATVYLPGELAGKKKQVLYIGRLDKTQKRVDRAVALFQQVAAKHPDWELVVVGNGPQRAEIETMSRGWDQIRIVGAVEDTEPYLRDAAVLLLTSQFEGFGLVLIEAQQFGAVPMAFASYDSVHDIIENGVNGCLVPPFDMPAYAQKLDELLSNNDLRHTIAFNGLETCNKFRIEEVEREWIDLFERL